MHVRQPHVHTVISNPPHHLQTSADRIISLWFRILIDPIDPLYLQEFVWLIEIEEETAFQLRSTADCLHRRYVFPDPSYESFRATKYQKITIELNLEPTNTFPESFRWTGGWNEGASKSAYHYVDTFSSDLHYVWAEDDILAWAILFAGGRLFATSSNASYCLNNQFTDVVFSVACRRPLERKTAVPREFGEHAAVDTDAIAGSRFIYWRVKVPLR
ncbi:hypothetical protein BDD12DRAFT_979535 [Trichophaea hybrida]|nr:hypothetical protein BDD12DRAFT_979535 [Trichophaea hybrida]